MSVYCSHIKSVDLLNTNTGSFSLGQDPQKNWNLKFSITLSTLFWSMPITLPESVCQDKKCNKSAVYKNWFCQSLYKLGLQYEPKQTMKIWFNWIRNRHSEFSFTTSYVFNSTRWSPGLYGRTREKHANSQTICSTHKISCKNVTWNLASQQIFQKILFQLSVDIGK